MDPGAAPWRVLEDVQTQDAEVATQDASGPPRPFPIPGSVLMTVGLALILAVVAFVLAFGSGSSGGVEVQGGAPMSSGKSPPSSDATMAAASSGRNLVVEIVGAVVHPGVYQLRSDARVGDLLAAAGGYGPRVDAERAGRELNLAAPLRDGVQVRVASRDDSPASTSGPPGGSTASNTGPVDLNAATVAQLDALPGIGPVTAAKIIASREDQPFAAVDDLRTRKLVGEKTFGQLRDLVTVR